MFIVDLYRYLKLKRIIDKIDAEEHVTENLSKQFGAKFKIDYAGRRYTILNPRIQGISQDDMGTSASQIYEMTDNGFQDKIFIERWCMDRVRAASMFIMNKELLDIMTFSLDRLDSYENYLFILKPILFDDTKESFKKFIKRTSAALIILAISFILYMTLR